MTLFFIIVISIYVLSVLACWNFIRISYSAGGIDEDAEPLDIIDLLLVLMPVVNTILAIMIWSTYSPRKPVTQNEVNRTEKWLNKIFCIKKRDA